MAAFTLSEMLDRTNTRANRDLDQAELYSLEALIDVAGIEAVLQGLSEICGLKAEHIAQAWQDTPLAKRWATLEGALADATNSVHRPKLRASMAHATTVLARLSAIKATKRRLQAQGLKVNHFSRRDLVTRAEAYLQDHRDELFAEAREEVERWRASGSLESAGRPEPQGLSLCRYQARNGERK